MSIIKTTTLAVLTLGAGLAIAPALYAQDTRSGSAGPNPQGGMMGGQGMMGGGMSDMMKMMENCNRMMQSMNNQSPQTPSTPGTPPATPGQRG
jgi:hypothetical protein